MAEEFKEITPESLDLVTNLLHQNPELVDLTELSQFKGLTEELMDAVVKNDKSSSYVFESNRVSNEIIYRYEDELFRENTYSHSTNNKIEPIIGYGDLGLLKHIAKRKNILVQLIKEYPNWIELLGAKTKREALEQIITYKDSDKLIEHIIDNVYLDEPAVDFIIDHTQNTPDLKRELYGKQFLTVAQVTRAGLTTVQSVSAGYTKNRVWNIYPVSDPKEGRPSWTNKGDVDMIGPNMPDAWAEAIITSKKDKVIQRFAMFGPKKYLPLIMREPTKKHSYYQYMDIIQARLSGNQELMWLNIFKNHYHGSY